MAPEINRTTAEPGLLSLNIVHCFWGFMNFLLKSICKSTTISYIVIRFTSAELNLRLQAPTFYTPMTWLGLLAGVSAGALIRIWFAFFEVLIFSL